jgi:hypothetical protein
MKYCPSCGKTLEEYEHDIIRCSNKKCGKFSASKQASRVIFRGMVYRINCGFAYSVECNKYNGEIRTIK